MYNPHDRLIVGAGSGVTCSLIANYDCSNHLHGLFNC